MGGFAATFLVPRAECLEGSRSRLAFLLYFCGGGWRDSVLLPVCLRGERGMEPCDGGCLFGGEDCGGYDGSKCGCVRCPNFEYCGVWLPPRLRAIFNGRCGNCEASFGRDLVFRDGGDECPICLDGDNGRMVEHASGCGHGVCIDCFQFQWNPPRPPLIPPENYGFRGSCGSVWWECAVLLVCSTCVADMDAWKRKYPALERRWRADDREQEERVEASIAGRADPCVCAVCRAAHRLGGGTAE